MLIDEKLIDHIALLSRLEFSEKDKKCFIGQLNQILEYVEKLKAVNTEKVEPLFHTFESVNIFRSDEPKLGLRPEETLSNAPDKEALFFRVPRVIE